LIGSIRKECLNHVVVFGAAHARMTCRTACLHDVSIVLGQALGGLAWPEHGGNIVFAEPGVGGATAKTSVETMESGGSANQSLRDEVAIKWRAIFR
jgi:hypothetical protein